MSIRVAVVGSRGFTDEALLEQTLDQIHAQTPIERVISGGARGADTLGARWADKHRIPTQIFKPDWEPFGIFDKSAGIRRNRDIVSHADLVVAFWDSVSRGTRSSINLAKEHGKGLIVVEYTKRKE